MTETTAGSSGTVTAHADASVEALAGPLARKAHFVQEAHDIEHDLRGPLGAIAVANELLRLSDSTATRLEVADVIQRQVARIAALTQRVHDLAARLAD
jgi:signal transduction histidine kinase